MPDAFVPLSVYVRRVQPISSNIDCATPENERPSSAQTGGPRSAAPASYVDAADGLGGAAAITMLCGELAVIRLAASEAFERATRELIRALGHEVFGRELTLAAIDIEALVGRAAAAFAQFQPMRIKVAADDAPRAVAALKTCTDPALAALPVSVDAALMPGDVSIEVRDGAFESHRSFRLQSVVEQAMNATVADTSVTSRAR